MARAQESPAAGDTADDKKKAALCDPTKYQEYLQNRKNAESPSNAELIADAEKDCRANLMELKTGMFGPPRFWDIFNVACKSQCEVWDGLVAGGLAVSRCSHKQLGIETQSTAFWQCKLLYDCYEDEEGYRDPLYHRENFCNGCGTSQIDEIEFYEELTCGAGIKRHRVDMVAYAVTWSFVLIAHVFVFMQACWAC